MSLEIQKLIDRFASRIYIIFVILQFFRYFKSLPRIKKKFIINIKKILTQIFENLII